MEDLLMFGFGIIYFFMIFNPITLYLLKKKLLSIVNVAIVILYLVNWFWMIGRIGYQGLFSITWVTLLSLCMILFFVSLSIIFVRMNSYKNYIVLPLIYIAGFVMILIINFIIPMFNNDFMVYAPSVLLFIFITAFIILFVKTRSKKN